MGPLRRARRYARLTREYSRLFVAGLYRRALSGRSFIAVTGSAGKTTTTALIRHLLSQRGEVHGTTPGENQATQIRPYLLRMPRSARAFVAEASGFPAGNIGRVVRLFQPTMTVVTRLGFDHYQEFRGPEGAAAEKGRLVRALPPGGVAVLNADDAHVLGMRTLTRARIVTFGITAEADVRAEDASATWPDRLSFTLVAGGERRAVRTRFVGLPWLTSALAATAAALAEGLTIDECVSGLETFEPLFQRWSLHEPVAGVHLVLDTFKAAQWTMAPVLDLLTSARAVRKVCIVSSMSDYAGSGSRRYRALARQVLEVADQVWFIGEGGRYVERLETGDGRLHVVPDVRTLCDEFWPTVRAGDLIVAKGVQGDHLERLLLTVDGRIACWRTGCGVRFTSCLTCQARLAPDLPPREV